MAFRVPQSNNRGLAAKTLTRLVPYLVRLDVVLLEQRRELAGGEFTLCSLFVLSPRSFVVVVKFREKVRRWEKNLLRWDPLLRSDA